MDGDQPRLRPIAPVKTEGFTVYIANLRSYGKTAEIEANPRVEICYLDGHNDQVRITGVAEVVTDKGLKAEIWESNPHLRNYMGDPENPDFLLYRVVPYAGSLHEGVGSHLPRGTIQAGIGRATAVSSESGMARRSRRIVPRSSLE